MWKFFQKINKNLIIAIPVMMVLGFGFGLIFNSAFLKSLIIPFTFLMVYPMMVTLKIKKVFAGGDVKAQVLTQIINFGIIPFIAFAIGRLFFKDQPYMALGLLMAGLVPTSGMTISWTGFAKGNVAAAVKMTVIGLTLGSLATPFYVKFLMGAEIEVNILAVMKQIVFIVFLPMVAGFITQQALIKKYGQQEFQKRIGPRFPALSTIGVLGIVFIAIALKSRTIYGSPQLLLYILAPLSIIYTINYALSTVVGKVFLPRGDAIALVYGSVMRNLSIALAIAINAFGPQGSSAALVVAIAYIIQVQSAAWYVRFTDTIHGPVAAPKPIVPEPVPAMTGSGSATDISPAPAPATEVPGMPSFKKVLYATDLSETARHAMRYACSVGHQYGADVTVLHVVPDMIEEFSAGAGIDIVEHMGREKFEAFNKEAIDKAKIAIRNRIQETLSALTQDLPACSLSGEHIAVRAGNPVNEICTVAREGDYDLVIIGSHGHGKLEEAMIGNVATGVIRRCTRPVMTIRLPESHQSV